MIITISGPAGAGKSTVAKLIARKLKLEHFSMGDLSREIAEKKGMTIEEFNEWGENNPERDQIIDDHQKYLGKEKTNMVIDGRLSFHFIPHSFKIYIDATKEIRAKRRLQDKKNSEVYKNLNEAIEKIKSRDEKDKKRYLERYGLNPFDHTHYDLVIDSSDKLPEVIIKKIIYKIHKKR